jgi:hypothetical protein
MPGAGYHGEKLLKHIIIMPHGLFVFTLYHHMLFKYTRKFQRGFYVVV